MQTFENPNGRIATDKNITSGQVRWKSPSNIAIIKYWGKHGRQLPRNPSISFTLSNALTDTIVRYKLRDTTTDGIQLAFRFEGESNPAFAKKVERFLRDMIPFFPFLEQLDLEIDSSNSFPHSAGIASSASAMSALALCLCSLERVLLGSLSDENEFLQKASFISRLGSGSACRSVYPIMGQWGGTHADEEASDLYATAYAKEVHSVFHNFHDDIMIVSKAEKSVSSRAGHGLMENNIFADNRYKQANERFEELLVALKEGDVATFGKIAEDEALTLHALMMASEPSYILLQPNTLTMIEAIRSFRAETNLHIYFSLDAGPNIHLLYPDEIKKEAQAFIQEQLIPLCEDGVYIADEVGNGPTEIH
ncbi:MAG: diphosphomevalonate/mevalonate 3,5-bisphosphate decarboxylase family protein [Saprospiraceae bacterium]